MVIVIDHAAFNEGIGFAKGRLTMDGDTEEPHNVPSFAALTGH